MNERIDKLFEQALEEFKAENKYATIIVPNPLKEKFAELIVRECADIADEYDGAGSTIVSRIQKHFEVES
jgi:hypothetical protein